ncbi:MAG: hypothetical protein J6B40_03520 [Oscillospiraceae bacterium]|nr:hypothetical protein [Oscillospiraceae bacterium]
MKNNKYVLSAALAVVLGVVMLVQVINRALIPGAVFPELNIPNMVLVSVIALILDHYIAGKADRCYLCIPLFAAFSFGLLPFVAGVSTVAEAVKMGIAGAVVFTVTTLLYTSIQDRLSTGPAAKAAPILSGFGLYLAFQCFAGMIL